MHRSRSIMALAVLASLAGGAATAGMKGQDRRPVAPVERDSQVAQTRPWVLYPDREDRARFRAYEARMMRAERATRDEEMRPNTPPARMAESMPRDVPSRDQTRDPDR